MMTPDRVGVSYVILLAGIEVPRETQAVDRRQGRANPFYVLLVLVGTAFALTACAYGVMAVKQLHASHASWSRTEVSLDANRPAQDAQFIAFMDKHGVRLMLTELAVLGAATALAMGTDRWWSGTE